MGHFKFKAVEPGKGQTDVVIDAASESDALQQLRRRGIIPVKSLGPVGGNSGIGFKMNRSALNIYDFTDRLVPLLDAGIQLEKSLAILEESTDQRDGKNVIRSMRRGLHEGRKFSELIRAEGNMFPPLYASLVETGEETGCLPEVARELRRFMNDSRNLKEFIVTSSIYPAIVLGVTLVVVILLFTVFIPRFAKIFDEMGRELPFVTMLMLQIGNVFKAIWWIWPLLIAGGVYFFKASRNPGPLKQWLDSFVLKMPLFGQLAQAIQMSRFVRTLAIMTQNHVHLLPAVKIAVKVIENDTISSSFGSVPNELKGGKKLSETLAQSAYMPRGSVPMLRIAEESGDVGAMLEQIADESERKIKVKVKRLLAVMEPVIILCLAVIVLLVVISIFLAIMEMNAI